MPRFLDRRDRSRRHRRGCRAWAGLRYLRHRSPSRLAGRRPTTAPGGRARVCPSARPRSPAKRRASPGPPQHRQVRARRLACRRRAARGSRRRGPIGRDPRLDTPRTGGSDGSSAGITFALADVDLLTPGHLGSGLRLAGTGTIGSDGVVTAVGGVDAKLAAARLVPADVIFASDLPSGTSSVTTVISHVGNDGPERRIGDWLTLPTTKCGPPSCCPSRAPCTRAGR
jgi:hypothetical protein